MSFDLKMGIRAVEDWWFDTVRHIKTSGDEAPPHPSTVVGEHRDSHLYAPVRVPNAHAALRDLPIASFSDYTFVDVGSGKGRMLFVAAEYPFRRILGVEYAEHLHRAAMENIRRFRHRRQRCSDITSEVANARTYEFPVDNLVVYLFNPFGADVMQCMLANLRRSIEAHPRHAVVVMLWPEHSDVVAETPGMRVSKLTRRYHIFETGTPPSSGVSR